MFRYDCLKCIKFYKFKFIGRNQLFMNPKYNSCMKCKSNSTTCKFKIIYDVYLDCSLRESDINDGKGTQNDPLNFKKVLFKYNGELKLEEFDKL